MATYMIVIYGLLVGWAVFSILYILRLYKLKNSNKINPYIYDSIPSVFTTLGILGTFVGIFSDCRNLMLITSMTAFRLYEGMKTASQHLFLEYCVR